MSDVPFVCYLLVRTDLDSLNPGKGMAQSHHCGTKLLWDSRSWSKEDKQDLEGWLAEGRGFGTVLTLGVTDAQMKAAVALACSIDCRAAIINDPTYPLRDGASFHQFPLDTCAYLFGPLPLLRNAIAVLGLELHP